MDKINTNVAMYVKKWMALGISLVILTISIGFLAGCNTTGQQFHQTSYSTGASTSQYYHPANSTVAVAFNYFKWRSHMMNDYDRKQQENAVFFALNNLQNGEVTRWYNGNTGAKGAVKIVMTYPQGSGYCRVIMSQIYYNSKQRDFKEVACINSVDNTWRFVR